MMSKTGILVIVGVLAASGVYFAFGSKRGITISGNIAPEPKRPSSIAGLPATAGCATAGRRPLAVMLASDPETRPLSGIGSADLVIEMPVTPNGVTRFMAVYQCQTPKEIGSIRSAREDFIPLAAGFSAVYAHWGGEHSALDRLNKKIVDNINALQFDGTVFYRKKNIRPPHNGFSSPDLLFGQAKSFGYNPAKDFTGYPHTDAAPAKNIANLTTSVAIPYPYPYDVKWVYKADRNLYARSRGGRPEIDRNDNKQVTASVIAVMHTSSRILYKGDQYIEIRTTGEGIAEIYQSGIKITGTWKKDPKRLDSKLYFFDQEGREIKFVPGQIWIEIVTS